MMEFKRFVNETPDDIYSAPGQVTFFYAKRASDISSRVTWRAEDKYPSLESDLERATIKATAGKFPCAFMPDGRGNIAIVPSGAAASTTMRVDASMSFGKLNSHDELVYAAIHSLLVTAGYGELATKFLTDMREDFDMDIPGRDVGVPGRFTSNHFATWDALDFYEVLAIIDAVERSGVKRFADAVTVDCTGEYSKTGEAGVEYPARRKRSGRFAS